ncbi:tryptophan--tRNA ligase [candidate division BRC1 bacterium HGW-BRC1-1]|jgi:tryptophanyl-tRNA synthetase|nr:MAG: tryptophan--tRNA ligase [candidate division BRC1 bacterium HGW-BRC1-1]
MTNRILSGMRPTGRLQLGNYVGALKNWVHLQDEYDCFFMIADWHALTSNYADPGDMRRNMRAVLLDWLASGIDPERSTIFVQSLVKEHAELNLLLGMFTPLAWLERCPTYKDQITQLANKEIETHGFLGYPVLMAADIILYRANFVPVGEDQLPHLEIAREIARRVNFFHGGPIETGTNLPTRPIFPEPEPLLSAIPRLAGLDGRKMSKSYDNAIYLDDTAETVQTKARSMMTDPARVRRTDPGNPDICPVFSYHKLFSSPEIVAEVDRDCRTAAIGCIDCKKLLANSLNTLLDPMRERRAVLENDTPRLTEILEAGNARAREEAERTMGVLRERLSLPASARDAVNAS